MYKRTAKGELQTLTNNTANTTATQDILWLQDLQ